MSIIYVPSGKAREYAPLACNLYKGCNHGCVYCYAPRISYKTREDFMALIEPRRNVLAELEKDCRKHTRSLEQLHFCFMTDPYNIVEKDLGITRDALKLCLKYKVPVSVLTKSDLVCRDIDVISKLGKNIKVGFTLTFSDDQKSLEYEPNAALPQQRLDALAKIKKAGITTWASFEPVIDPEQSLKIMGRSLGVVDVYKVGKVNNWNGLDKQIDWVDFLTRAVMLLRKNKKPFYVKKDLREAAQSVKLFGNETNMDEFNLAWEDD